ERRLFLSAAALTHLAAQDARAAVTTGVRRTVAPTLSLADRQELLANWVGSDAATLQGFLNANDTLGFDNELLSYMQNRSNRHYYFELGDDTGIINFINSEDRKSTRLNSSHVEISYAVFCLKKKKSSTSH